MISCKGCDDCFLDAQGILKCQQEITDLYTKAAGTRELSEMSDSGILGLNKDNFRSYKTKIRNDLEKGFGLYALPEVAIESVGKKPATRYGIRIDKSRIRVVF